MCLLDIFTSILVVSYNRLSKYWVLGKSKEEPEFRRSIFRLTFKEWANDDYFYDKLTDEYERETDIFKKYRKLIEEKSKDKFKNLFYEDKKIKMAPLIEKAWWQCPECGDAWEVEHVDRFVTCLECRIKSRIE